MSRALLDATGNHLHSPVDDLESCFWVSVWSIFFNRDNMEGRPRQEMVLVDHLSRNNRETALSTLRRLRHADICDITQCFRTVLLEWWAKVEEQGEMWVDEVLENEPENAGQEYFLPCFHRFALQGVVDVLQVLAEHWDGEISWENWKGPTGTSST